MRIAISYLGCVLVIAACGGDPSVITDADAGSGSCGARGEACCHGSACDPGLSCRDDACQSVASCGGEDEACCQDDSCDSGLRCVTGTCQTSTSCGGNGQACCSGETCNSGLACSNGSCQATTECGGSGQACCSGETCNSGLTCSNGTCQESASCFGDFALHFSSWQGEAVFQACDSSRPATNCKDGHSIVFSDTGECICIPECRSLEGVQLGDWCDTGHTYRCTAVRNASGASSGNFCVSVNWNLCGP